MPELVLHLHSFLFLFRDSANGVNPDQGLHCLPVSLSRLFLLCCFTSTVNI